MKTLRYNICAHAIALLTLGGLATACVEEDLMTIDNLGVESGLAITPQLFGLNYGNPEATRALSNEDIEGLKTPIDELRENYMGDKLSVFVVGNGTNNASFFNRYTFSGSEIQSQYYTMEQNWKHVQPYLQTANANNQQYVVGDKYKLYAMVNYNGPEITSLDQLKSAKAGYQSDGTTPYGNIYRWFSTNQFSADPRYDGWDREKVFEMDGATAFEFTSTDKDKKVDVYMKRACAKIVLDMKVDPNFLKSIIITQNEGTEQETKEIVAGGPRFRPLNFNYHAWAIDSIEHPTTLDPLYITQEMYNIPATNVTDGAEVEDPKREYQLTTYSYPCSWDGDELEHTPALIVSLGIKATATGSTEFYYYRIPITNKDIKELKRNYVYHIDATITGFGARQVYDDLEGVVNLHYDVIPWVVIPSEISIVDVEHDVDFLMVEPQSQNIYGEGTQTGTVNYYAPMGSTVNYDQLEVYYYNASGTKVTNGDHNNDNANSGTKTYWSGAMVTHNTADHMFSVASAVLENHAVKYIRMRVFLDSDGDGSYDDGEKFQYVTVTHYPMQSLQNISGKWSSRWDGTDATTTVTVRQYSFNPVADGWESGSYNANNYEDNIECTLAEYEKADPSHRSSTTETDVIDATQEDFISHVTNNTDRANANSQSSGFGYWGGGTIHHIGYRYAGNNTTTNQGPSDYYQGYNNKWAYDFYVREYDSNYYRYYFEYYKYSYYYTTGPVIKYYARRYYRDVTMTVPSTGLWTDYEKKTGSRYSGINIQGNNNNGYSGFEAKWTQGDNQQIRYLRANGTDGGYDNSLDDLTNNHMYIIQITEANADYTYGNVDGKYTIGHPILNGSYQSYDNVVAPAFMIASQLGAVDRRAFNASRAATHCSSYMEVGTDGTRYVGWRLPTAAEVDYIVDWQEKGWDTIARVLGGQAYYTLDGYSQPTGIPNATEGNFVRCIRELSPEEVKRINASFQ